jgi:cytochrome c oxidase subunit III
MSSGLHEPFENFAAQRRASELGLWVFLASEIIFFSGLFLAYATYRSKFPEGFNAGGAETDIVLGSVNTAILLTSSATMAVAVWAGKAGLARQVRLALALTIGLGLAFLAVKGYEYHKDVSEHLLPRSARFPVAEDGARMFFTLYWLLTATHVVHLTIGICVLSVSLLRIWRERMNWRDTAVLHTIGLYWHLIDLIWIFLYPLLYFPGR